MLLSNYQLDLLVRTFHRGVLSWAEILYRVGDEKLTNELIGTYQEYLDAFGGAKARLATIVHNVQQREGTVDTPELWELKRLVELLP